MYPIFTSSEANKILNSDGEIELSLDLGISKEKISIENNFAIIRSQKIKLKEFEKIKENFFYILDNEGNIKQVSLFSKTTNIYYKLQPTGSWPTLRLSSVPMHRHIHQSPKEDTEIKIKEISPVKGVILDTCCGLGYTAIMAAKQGDKVLTFERDMNVLHIASFNPFSQELFNNKKIEIYNKDIYEYIKNFESDFFNRIIHDPPTFKISPELYAQEFHAQLFRVLKKGGILYHYCPFPGKTRGNEFYKRILNQLSKAGFKNAEYHGYSSGIRAVKI